MPFEFPQDYTPKATNPEQLAWIHSLNRSDWTHAEAMENPHMPVEILSKVLKNPDAYWSAIVRGILLNPNIPGHLLVDFVKTNEDRTAY